MSWSTPIDRRGSLSAVLAAVFAFAACGGSGENTSAPSTAPGRPDQVEQLADPSVERFLDDTLPEGASGTLAAARDGELVHCKGFGTADRETQAAAQCDTVYDIGSVTKQFTAAAILKLEMMGQLRVTDPMSKFFGPVPDDKRDVTVHQLLTHTAGLPDGLGDDYEALSRKDMVAGALESKLQSPPGSEYHYSNLGYGILAAIIEEVSNMGYEEFLAEHLFGPAGMSQTGYVLPEWPPDQVAIEYDEHGKPQGRPFDHPWAEDGPYWNLRGNGGLLSTARDMFRWHLALEGDEIVDQRAKDKLFRPHVREQEGGDTYYGYGWVVSSTDDYGKVVWHDGGNGWSFDVFTRLVDERLMVFWATNHYKNKDEGWNLYQLEPKLTLGVADLVRDLD